MSKGIREHFKSLFYNPHRTQKRSGKRFPKAFEFYIDLLKKQSKGNMESWVSATMPKAIERLKKYGINKLMIEKKLDHKGLSSLKDLINIK